MTPASGLALLFFLAIFAPLTFIYGRSFAGRAHAQAHRQGRSAVALMLPKLVLPALVASATLFRFSGSDLDAALAGIASGTLRAALSLLWFLGSLFGILFFLSVPFVFGRLFAFAAVALGWFRDVADEPLRFGASGFRQRAAREEAEDGDA